MLALTLGTSAAWASAPEGPRLAVTRWPLRHAPFELVTMDPVGASEQTVVRGSVKRLPRPVPYGAPAWSPDGNALAFTAITGLPGKRNGNLPSVQIFIVSADGGGLHAVPGTRGGYEPVFSPDGRKLAFARLRRRTRKNSRGGEDVVYESTTAWLADLAGGRPRQLTQWRNHLFNAPSSFSPDGSVLALSRRIGEERMQAIALHLDGRGSTTLSRNGFAPRYSPDGTTIALLRGRRRTFTQRHREGNVLSEFSVTSLVTDLFEMRADGAGMHRITNTPGLSESAVSWDPSGQRIAYTAEAADGLLPFGDTIMEANADGTCATPVLTDFEFAYIGPAWQPGPGREAGPISC